MISVSTQLPLAPAAALDYLWRDRVLAVIRCEAIPDPVGLCRALVRGGIRTIEFTCTTPNVDTVVRIASEAVGDEAIIGVGTVLAVDQARRAIDAGARFLVTPCVRTDVAEAAALGNVPVLMGAMTPGEVLCAHEAGATAVKVFPAGALGSKYLQDLHGPFPDIALVPSSGISAANAAEYLLHGAAAVTAGTGVAQPALIAAARWDEISRRATEFTASLGYPR